jgi:glycosyltransferase involved in cell wall biosynthesis
MRKARRPAHRPVVLTLLGHYLPGHKGGGSIRSIAHLIEALGGDYAFRVVTTDRDIGDSQQYPSVIPFRWRRVGRAAVLYLTPGLRRLVGVVSLLRAGDYQVLYLNSFFARLFSILPIALRRTGLIPNRPIVIAPRGEFSAGALATKRRRKRAYARLARRFSLYSGVVWQASTDLEAATISTALGLNPAALERPVRANNPRAARATALVVAGDLAGAIAGSPARRSKTPGVLRVVFLSRISQKKNLSGAIRMLRGLTGTIDFSIYGPIEHKRYWAACQSEMERLPAHVRATYRGEVPHSAVPSVLAEHDIFLFPTLGENYGHVIVEALLAGCPVVTSDQTPWNDIQANRAGWALPLEPETAFTDVLESCVWMDDQGFRPLTEHAMDYGRKLADPRVSETQHRELFNRALERAANCEREQ